MKISHTTPTGLTARSAEAGASLVEYALLLALIAIVCMSGVALLGRNANTKLSKAAASGAQTEQDFENACSSAGNQPYADVSFHPTQIQCRQGGDNGPVIGVYSGG